MATQTVFKYLQDTNRPYSANDIVQNMHKEYSKAQIQKSLDELVADGSIIEKVYGKQKVYCIKQNDTVEENDEELTELNAKENHLNDIVSNITRNLDSAEKTMKSIYTKLNKKNKAVDQEKLKEIDERLNIIIEMLTLRKNNDCPESITSTTELLTNLKNELTTTESSLKTLLSEPTTEEALNEANQLKNSNTKMSEKIDLLKKSTNLIPEKEKTVITKAKNANLNEYKKRKRLCLSVINEILENYPKSKKVLLEEIGIDQDGDQILDQIPI